jgi:hypothetical protein
MVYLLELILYFALPFHSVYLTFNFHYVLISNPRFFPSTYVSLLNLLFYFFIRVLLSNFFFYYFGFFQFSSSFFFLFRVPEKEFLKAFKNHPRLKTKVNNFHRQMASSNTSDEDFVAIRPEWTTVDRIIACRFDCLAIYFPPFLYAK